MQRSIRSKIIVTMLTLTFSACLSITFASYISAKKSLETNLYASFESIRIAKQNDVIDYVDHLRKHARMLTENPWYANEVMQLSKAFDSLNPGKLTETERQKLQEYYRTEVFDPLSKVTQEELDVEALFPVKDLGQVLQYREFTKDEEGKEPIDRAKDSFGSLQLNLRERLKSLAKTLEFLNIRIVHPQTGITIFALEPEIDYGISLYEGYLAKTLLSKAVRDVVANPDPMKVRLVDFERYLPLGNRPSAFLVSPVFANKELAGIAVFRISGERLTEIVNGLPTDGSRSLGLTGEVFLVGEDTLMRTESRFFSEDRSKYSKALEAADFAPDVIRNVDRFGTTVLTVPRQAKAVKTIFEKGPLTWSPIGYLGTKVIASNAPLNIDDVRWGIVALIQEQEAFAPVRTLRIRLIALSSAIFLVAAGIGMWLGGSLVEPIERLTMAARSLASGFRDVRVNVNTNDELETLGHSFNDMAIVIEKERAGNRKTHYENDCLLETIMPPDLMAHLWGGPHPADESGLHGEVTVSYSRIHGVKKLYQHNSPESSTCLMNSLSEELEKSAIKNGVRPLAFGGGSCFAISGLDGHRGPGTSAMVRFADELRGVLKEFNQVHGSTLSVTTCINSGPIASGIIGHQEFFHALWRPTMKLVDLKADSTGEVEYRIIVTQKAFDNIVHSMPDLVIGNEFQGSDGQNCRNVWLVPTG